MMDTGRGSDISKQQLKQGNQSSSTDSQWIGTPAACLSCTGNVFDVHGAESPFCPSQRT
jgi:hypothetical protein